MGVDFIKKCIAWSLIITLTVNADTYAKVATMIYNLDSEVVGLFTGRPYDGNTLDQVLDEFNKIDDDMEQVWESMGWKAKLVSAFSIFPQRFTLHILGAVFLIICFATYIVNKLLLVLTLLVGPLAIGLGLFPSTRNYMLNWINQCVNFILVCVFIGLIGEFQISYLDAIKPTYEQWGPTQLALFNLSLLMGTILFAVIIWNLPALASALVGGEAQASGHAHGAKAVASGMAGGSLMAGKGGAKGVAKGYRFFTGKGKVKPTSTN